MVQIYRAFCYDFSFFLHLVEENYPMADFLTGKINLQPKQFFEVKKGQMFRENFQRIAVVWYLL